MAADGPRLLSIAPNSGGIFSTTSANSLSESPRELVLRFDANLSAASVQNGSGIRITRAGGDGDFTNPGTVVVQPAFLNFSDPQNQRVVVARFSQPLLDDLYRVEVFGVDIPSQSVSALRDTVGSGQLLKPRRSGTDRDTYDFDLELGTKISAVVPQPIVRDAATGALTRRGDQIEVYFNDSELYNLPVTSTLAGPNPSVVNPNFYNLIFTKDTVLPSDDVVFTPKPDGVTYDPVAKKATLTFAQDIDQLTGVGGTFRLRVGTSLAATPTSLLDLTGSEPGGDLQSATTIGTSGSFSTVIKQQIVTTTNPLLNDFPGSNFEPGHRDVQDESHLVTTSDATQGISTFFYSFMENQPYGKDSLGRPIFSSITAEQKQRVREIFEFYSAQLGIDVVEHLGPTVTGDGIKKVVVGDLNPLGAASEPGNEFFGLAEPAGELAIMDGSVAWDNTFGLGSNIPNTKVFFQTALHEIGHLLGLDHSYDLPPGNSQGSEALLGRSANPLEQIFPGSNDVVHGQRIFRPDNRDVDLYRFVLAEKGDFRAETLAERLNDSSNLDTYLSLLRRDSVTGALSVVATNNNYFSDDSLISLSLEPGEYFISVTGKGNEDNNPEASNTGSGAVSQGRYDLRIDFKSSVVSGIVEEAAGSTRKGSALDGDGDGIAGGNFDFWFRAAALPAAGDPPVSVAAALGSAANPTTPRTLVVDRAFTGAGVANGSVALPYNRISQATAVARPGDIIRMVGDSRTPTNLTDEAAYEIGDGGGSVGTLGDGASLDVPRGVTLMLEAGAILKFGGSRILVGSNDSTSDRSSAAVQVLGIPGLPVYFTSYSDESLGKDNNPLTTTPAAGNWGGIEIRNDFDRAQGRFDREREGIFLNTISNADMRFGGGQVGVGASAKVVSPIDLSEARPLILGNRITRSGDSAISADPNSFEETLFTEPRYQNGGAFVPDYSRVGPDIRSNTLTNNSINGLFVRIDTLAGQNLKTLNVAGRMNDSEITIVLGENLIIEGTPGGATRELVGPDIALVSTTAFASGGGFGIGANAATGVVSYIVTYIDRFGQESLRSATIAGPTVGVGGAVRLNQLPTATLDYVSRRIWRQVGVGGFVLAGVVNRDDTSFVDNGLILAGTIPQVAASTQRAKRDASLVVDPGSVIKSLGGRIEVGVSATMLAEGTESKPIVFTSRLDDRFGAAGSFDTNNDGSAASRPAAGNWAGIVARHLGELSIDNALITFGGGNSRVPGGFASFNAIEVHQSTARIANSVIEKNASGAGTAGTTNRDARGKNDEAAIFVLGSQPLILNNIIRDNFTNAADRDTSAVSIDANSLNSERVFDYGRSTGTNQRENVGLGNFGPLVNNNQLGRNSLNGMVVRGATLTTESVWDDTDIVHILQSEIVIPDFHTYGGLRLTSKADESLVVKLSGANAGFTASGRPLDIKDRIGGSLQIIGAQGFPVVLTSLSDDTIGAGFDFAGGSLVDTNNNGPSVGTAGDWRSVRFEPLSNDRNVDFNYEREADQIADKGTNDFPSDAQDLGLLAANLSNSDENLRLGVTLTGSIASPGDLDVYRFVGTAGSTLWIDLDQTSSTLDSVVELIDGNGQIIALSNNSLDESVAGSVFFNPALIPSGRVWPIDQIASSKTNTLQPLAQVDFLGVNPLDAGFRVVLPGSAGSQNNYFVRVRSSNVSPVDLLGVARSNPARLTDPALVRNGITVGEYKMQLRLQQTQEVAGSTVRFADIRFATTGIEALGQPLHSPLLGEVGESNPNEANATSGSAISIGNILSNDRGASSIAGSLAANGDIDWYNFTIVRDSIQSVSPNSGHHSVTFDIDYADGLGRPNTQLWIFQGDTLVATADNSNIQDDQPAVLRGTDVTDLTRGSLGNRDAYIGPIELPAGSYRVAVSNGSLSHIASQQFTNSTTTQNLVRFEPLDSVRRISEDRFDASAPSRPTTNQAPVMAAFGNEGAALTSNAPNFGNAGLPNAVPFNLSDVTLFVATNAGSQSRMQLANALTGAKEAEISLDGTNGVNIAAANGLNDIAVSPAGAAFGALAPNPGVVSDSNAGTFIGINIGDAGAPIPAGVGSGIQTFATFLDTATPPNKVVRKSQDAGGNQIGDGMVFTGLTFSDFNPNGNTVTFWGVATRRGDGGFNETPQTPRPNTRNILYRLDPTTGAALSWDTGLGDRTGNALANGAGTQKIEFGRFSNAVGTVTGLTTLNQNFFGVTDQGELVTTTGGRIVINDPTTGPIAFTGMTTGPRNVENGRFANMLFGITAAGRIYAFDTAGVLQPIFPRGATSIQGTDLGTVAGIDFSSLDVNLWHSSTQESSVAGHGRPGNFNNSRNATNGNDSLKFGFSNPNGQSQIGNWGGIYDVPNFRDNSALPGGAMGALESDLIDLRDYSANDQPMLYFNYSIVNQNSAANNDGSALGGSDQPALDAFRVYGIGEKGEWVLLGTNNSARDSDFQGNTQEYDVPLNGNKDIFGRSYVSSELFDNQGWRQARINLAPLAGQRDIRIRFEFSTGGDFRTNDPLRGGVELVAVAGDRIKDGDFITVSGTRFEFDLGLVLNIPSGASIVSGTDGIRLNGVTHFFGTDIAFNAADTPLQLAAKVSTYLVGRGFGVATNSSTANVLNVSGVVTASIIGGDPAIIIGNPGVASGNPIPITNAMTATQVRDAINNSLMAAFNAPGQRGPNFGEASSLNRVRGNSIILFNETLGAKQGPVGGTTNRIGDQFGPQDGAGAFSQSAYLRAGLRTQTNLQTLVRLDDVVIGFAERGEMVMGAPAGMDSFQSTFQYENAGGLNGAGANELETGAYQLEVRTASDYGTTQGGELHLETTIAGPLGRTIDTNDRLTKSFALVFNTASRIADGATFTLSDGNNTTTFEFDVITSAADRRSGVTPGNQPIIITPNATAVEIARAVRDAINDSTTQADLKITATTSGDMQGVVGSVLADLTSARSDRVQLNGQVSSNTLGKVTGFTSGGVPLTLVAYGQDSKWGEDLGDANVTRDQGQFIISSSSISDSSGFGLNIDAAAQSQTTLSNFAGNRPYPGAVRNLVTLNSSNVAPGAVVMNNVIARNASGGIRISGDTVNANGNPPLTVARILNNTLFGRGTTDTGILVNEGASPTLMNNIVSQFQTGISVAGTGTAVLGANLYQSNGANTSPANLPQSFETNLAPGAPLFINSAIGRFYLASLSQAIDSSIASLENRSSIEQVKDGVGLATSPVLAPSFDLNGLRRGDDPDVNTLNGLGQTVFIDRGAIDRVDFLGPIAVIQRPLDNDSQNLDRDLTSTYLRLRTGNFDFFEILLDEKSGTGTDPLTITANSLILTENGRRLVEGSDYIFGFSANSRTIRLTPLSGFWRADSTYEVTLVNKFSYRLSMPSGSALVDGQKLTFNVGSTPVVMEFDTGDGVTSGAIPVLYQSTFTPAMVAGALLKALRANNLVNAGVTASAMAIDQLLISGVNNLAISPSLASFTSVAIPAITDVAQNPLQANRSSSLTQFTIVMPEVGVDYGDAIRRASSAATSGTLQADNGARHALFPSDVPVLALGQFADADLDGKPSPAADGDDLGSAFSFSAGVPLSLSNRGATKVVVSTPVFPAIVGKTFSITDAVGKSVTFEFTNTTAWATATSYAAGVFITNGGNLYQSLSAHTSGVFATDLAAANWVLATKDTAGLNIGINLTVGMTAQQTASTIANSIFSNAIVRGLITGITPVADGNTVALGGTPVHVFNFSNSGGFVTKQASGSVGIVVASNVAGLAAGQTFTIQDGSGRSVTFQFINSASPTPLLAGNTAISLDLTAGVQTQTSVTAAVLTAINDSIAAGKLRLPPATIEVGSVDTITINADDEDGVQFKGLFNAKTPPVTVGVTTTDTGYLDAWIDWNQDNDFDDVGERVIVSEPVIAGLNTFLVSTPTAAAIGYTTARFRLSATGGLITTGLGIGGEVEDHLIEVLGGTPPTAVNDNFTVLEDTTLNIAAAGVLTNDSDADGDPFSVFDSNLIPSDGVQPLVAPRHAKSFTLRADGSFSYTPADNFFGTLLPDGSIDFTDTFVYEVTDPRLVSSRPATVTITITPVNDAPFGTDSRQPINEDNNGIPFVFSAANFGFNDPTDLPASNSLLEVQILTLPNASEGVLKLGLTNVVAGQVIPVAAISSLTFTPASDLNGLNKGSFTFKVRDNGGTANSGIDTSVLPNTFAFDIAAINDAPSFTLPNATINLSEDPGAQNLTGFITNVQVGPSTAADEIATQMVTFRVRALDPSRFAVQPAVNPALIAHGGVGNLTFTLAPDVNNVNSGPILVELQADDQGGPGTFPNGPLSLRRTVTINVAQVNDPPTFTISQTIFNTTEDAPRTIIPGFVSNVLVGPATAIDETANQTAVPTVRAVNPSLFSFGPTLNGSGDLEFQLAPDVNSLFTGALEIVVTVKDDGTPVEAASKTLTIVATAINDSPSFVINPLKTTINVDEDNEILNYQAVTIVDNFALNLRQGPATARDEAGLESVAAQTLSFDPVIISNPSIFAQLPTIDAAGRLIFRTEANRSGSSVFVIRLRDNGLAGPPPNSNTGPTATYTINIRSVNDAPEFSIPLSTTVDEDQGVATIPGFATGIRPGPASAVDESTQELTFVVTAADPSVFTVQPTIQADGTLVFQTAKDVNNNTRGSDGALLKRQIVVSLRDNGASTSPNVNQSANQTFTLNINPVNDPPIPSVHVRPGTEDTLASFSAASIINAASPDRPDAPGPADESAQIVRMTQIERTTDRGGVVTPVFGTGLQSDQIISFTYNPPLNYVGDDLIRYVVTDDGSPQQSATGTLTIQLAPVNDPPQFIPGSDIAVQEDSVAFSAPWATAILAGPASAVDELNGVPPLTPAQTVSFAITTDNNALFAVLPAVSSTGVLTFTLAKDANGRAIVDVVAVDSGLGVGQDINRSAVAKLTIVANPVNDAPGFNVIGNVTVDEDSNRYSAAAIKDIVPAEGMNSTPSTGNDEVGQVISIITSNNNTSLFSVQPTVSSTGILEFVPAQDAFGTAIVSVVARDNGANTLPNVNQSAAKTFTITLTPKNDAPIGVNDRYTTGEDTVLTVNAPGLLSNDRDVDLPNDAISVASSQATSTLGAIVSVLPNGQFTYDSRTAAQLQRLVNGETAVDTFTYTIKDASGVLSNLATVTITVSGNNDTPIAVDDNLSIPFGTSQLLNVLANDRDPDTSIDPRTVEIGQLASHGTAVAQSTGRIDYRPVAGFRGVDTFTYRVRDALGAISNEAVVTVTVNTPPVAVADFVRTSLDTPVVIDVLRNDNDQDGTLNPSSVVIGSGPDAGSATVQTNGSIRYAPPAGFAGTATLQYSVLDNDGLASNFATVSIVVGGSVHQNPVNNLDVDADGFVSPIDVLILVNDINFNNSRVLPTTLATPPYLDPDGDGRIGPLDVLAVINFINSRGNAGAGEGEASMATLGYSQEIVRAPSKQEIIVGLIQAEYEASTEGQIDLAVSSVASESMTYGPSLVTDFNEEDADDSLESYLASWTTKPKRSASALDSVFADEDWM